MDVNYRHTLNSISANNLNTRHIEERNNTLKKPSFERYSLLSVPKENKDQNKQSISKQSISSTSNSSRSSSFHRQSRPSSARFSAHSQSKLQEPRPIDDKSYQKDCMQQIAHYLSTHGYIGQINIKLLSQPSCKEFLSIFSFLIQEIDPFAIIDKMEAVPLYFKKFGYPFNISKSSIISVGSPHSWPTFLAGLSWLVELLQCFEKIQNKNREMLDDSSEMAFYQWLGNSYQRFLNFEDEEDDEIDQDLVKTFQDKNQMVSNAILQMRESNQQIRDEIQQIQNQQEQIEQLNSQRQDFLNDIEKFNRLLQVLQDHEIQVKDTLLHRQKEYQHQTEIIKKLEEEQKKLNFEISLQELSPHSIHNIQQEKILLEQVSSTLLTQIADVQQKIDDIDLQITNIEQIIQKKCKEFDFNCEKIQLNFDQPLMLNSDHSDLENMFNLDLKNHTIKYTIEQISQQMTELMKKSRYLDDQLTSSQNQLSETDNQLQILQKRYSKYERLLIEEKGNFQKESESITQKIKEYQIENDQLNKNGSNNLDIKIKEIENEIIMTKKQINSEKDQKLAEMMKILEFFKNHRQECYDLLEKNCLDIQNIKKKIIDYTI